MIIAKIMDYESLKISSKPEGSVICRKGKSDYYLGHGMYDKEYIGGELKQGLSYYYAIELEIKEDIIYIFDEDTYLISFDEKGDILDKVKYSPEDFNLKYVKDLRRIYLWQLFVVLDVDSIEGRKVLLKNYFPDCNIKLDNIPEIFKIATKECDTTFCISEEHVKEEFVPLDKVVGLIHPKYAGLSWVNTFCHLKRMGNIFESLVDSKYYSDIENGAIEAKDIEFEKVDDEYYVSSGAHRVTIAKLKNIKAIYATVSTYTTSKFHKEYYEKLVNLEFEVRLCGKEDTYYNILTEHNYKYDWEVFEVSINNESILLFNKEMISQFYSDFSNLNVSDRAIKFRDYYKVFKKIYSFLFSKKHYESDDEWENNNVTSAIENFFIKNNKMISEHKKNLNKI